MCDSFSRLVAGERKRIFFVARVLKGQGYSRILREARSLNNQENPDTKNARIAQDCDRPSESYRKARFNGGTVAGMRLDFHSPT